ncbi:MAG: hypothetical protein K9J37_21790 [Saprospiraceae bacterium]|nr:hypothetical protein [Saprospiraceae bacterium]MCF8252554.1 hypothetical protein [Saprospiraceae bacterium]MCF8282595.1 hypothetical protein [Bacteroidales bacterium]MCF8310801.1 hypothetical protein [Saprospiraceae bacterium]MCF8439369.1 hypothetical protein [Saprospiraceae bacterium]
MEIFNNINFWITAIIAFVVIIGIFAFKNFKGNISKDSLSFDGSKEGGKDNIVIKNVKNESNVDVNSISGQNMKIEEVDKSEIKVNKDLPQK